MREVIKTAPTVDEAIALAFGKLQEGSYAEYGAQMKRKFLENLGG